MKKFAAAVLVLSSTPLGSPAAAQYNTFEEQDAYYASCVEQYVARNMGTPDQAAAYCYTKAYGSETTGGGQPNTYPRPAPGPDCWGSFNLGCNPYEKPT